jgi:hypothetical protein
VNCDGTAILRFSYSLCSVSPWLDYIENIQEKGISISKGEKPVRRPRRRWHTGGHGEERKEPYNNINTKFREELIVYFPLMPH